MWHTSIGDRTLSGAEAQLVNESARLLVDRLRDEIRYGGPAIGGSNVALFDEQPMGHRIALLDQVCRYLLSDTDSILELTAELEATVMAIYAFAKQWIEIESDMSRFDEPECHMRTLVLAAYNYSCPESNEAEVDMDDDPAPDVWCDDIDEWDFIIEMLADRVLWDRDFEMAGLIVDEDPEMADAYKQVLGIEADYFAKAPPEVDDQDAIMFLDKLCAFLDGELPRKPR